MAAKKFNHEVEKVFKECRTQMECFDDKWRSLRALTAEFTVLQTISPEASGGGMKAKKKVGNRPQCLESMDQRYVQDSISKLKNELEIAHKKLYKFRNEMDRLAGSPDLKNSGRNIQLFLDWKKEIEQRSKKGKTFYLKGVSSDITDVNDFCSASETISWIIKYTDDLKQQVDEMRVRMQNNVTECVNLDQNDVLIGIIEIHQLHIFRLERILECLEYRTISNKGYKYNSNEEGYVVQALADAAALAEKDGEDDQDSDQADLLDELRIDLEPYLYNNDDLTHIVCEEIYDRLPINFDEVYEEKRQPEEAVSSPHALNDSESSSGKCKANEEGQLKLSSPAKVLVASPSTPTPNQPAPSSPIAKPKSAVTSPSKWTQNLAPVIEQNAVPEVTVATPIKSPASMPSSQKEPPKPPTTIPTFPTIAAGAQKVSPNGNTTTSSLPMAPMAPMASSNAEPKSTPQQTGEFYRWSLIQPMFDQVMEKPHWQHWLDQMFYPVPNPIVPPNVETRQDTSRCHQEKSGDIMFNIQVISPCYDSKQKTIKGNIPKPDRKELPNVLQLLQTAQQSGTEASSVVTRVGSLDSDVVAIESWAPPPQYQVAHRMQKYGLANVDESEFSNNSRLLDAMNSGAVTEEHNIKTTYLSLVKGDMVQTVAAVPDGWIFGRNRISGASGWFPAALTITIPKSSRDLYQRFASIKFKDKARSLASTSSLTIS